MSEDILPQEQVVDAELWLMPEFIGKRVFTGSLTGRAGSSEKSASDLAQQQSQSQPQSRPTSSPAGFARGSASQTADGAKPRAQFTRAMTASQLQLLEQEAKEEGFKQGRAEGYEKGYAEGELRARESVEQHAKSTLAAQQSTLSQLVVSIIDPLAEQRDALQKALTRLVAAIAERVCYRELLSDSSSILTVVSESIDALPIGESNIKIFLNPDDLTIIQSLPDFVQDNWPLAADPQLQIGDCRVESDHSLVDFTRSSRLQTILDETFSLEEQR